MLHRISGVKTSAKLWIIPGRISPRFQAPGRQKNFKNSSKKSGKDFKNFWQKLQKKMISKTA
jgi:hypothetical protein